LADRRAAIPRVSAALELEDGSGLAGLAQQRAIR
jgi:hypothetical protein